MKKTIDVANVLLQNSASEILILQRAPRLNRGYYWGLPGGMIDPGETPLEAATRELVEETGVKESDISINGLMRFLVKMPEENISIISVRAKLINGSAAVNIDPAEHIAYKWSSVDEILNSRELLPCVPTMIAMALDSKKDFVDLSISPGTVVSQL